jgi:hypothetical protein
MATYQPTGKEISEAMKYPTKPGQYDGTSKTRYLPRPYAGSRQLQGEGMQDFFDRMDDDGREILAFEAPEEITLRQENELKAEQDRTNPDLLEPTIGTAIFEWIEDYEGNILRRPLSRTEWQLRWPVYPVDQRRYNAYSEEWDLWGESQDEADLSPILPDDDDTPLASDWVTERPPDSLESVMENIAPSAEEASGKVLRPKPMEQPDWDERRTFMVDLQQTYGDTMKKDSVSTPSLSDVLHNHYGYLTTTPYTTPPSMANIPQTFTAPLQALSALGVKEYLNTDLAEAVFDAFNFIMAKYSTPHAFSPPAWNLGPELYDRIINHPKFQYHRVDAKLHLIGVQGNELRHQWYLVALKSASTVVQIFRENPPSIGEMVRSLVRRGIPFATVKCVNDSPAKDIEGRRRSGGFVSYSKNYTFGPTAYNAYQARRDAILNGDRGRAALMAGGIVWRLAIESTPVKSVTKGPGRIVRNRGYVHGELDTRPLVDDHLEDDEENAICGVYRIRTGKNRSDFPRSR